MHAYILPYVFLLLLASTSLQLPNLIIVEARKLVIPNNGVFKVDLIHRDSPLSPYYNSSMTPQERLKRAPLGSISRGHDIQLSSKYYYDTNDVQLSTLTPNGGDYLIKIALGTPKVEFMAVADTGSDLIWVQCSPCHNCIQQQSPLFEPTKSSTFQAIPCNSPSCNHLDVDTGCPSNNESSSCAYKVSYGDKTQSIGILATETISLPSLDAPSTSLSSAIFGCGLDQQGRLGIQGEGIVGLGTGPSSLISQLGPNINNKFSYCLAPLSSGVTSKLTFGEDVTDPKVMSTPFRVAQDPTYYILTLDAIRVEDKNNPAQVPVGQEVIIDSGTTLTYLPTSIYTDVRASLVRAIGLDTVPSPLKPIDLCYSTQSSGSGGQFSPPDVTFQFKGAEVVLKAINTFRQIEDDVTCLAIIATNSIPIFGNIAQVNFQVGYDLQAKQVSFAPADCTNH